MTDRLEGTLVMDGLLEGRLPNLPDTQEKLRQWCTLTEKTGVPFRVKTDGDRFSVMPDSQPVAMDGFAGDAQETIRKMLDELVKIFPSGERTSLFSTVRSREYKPGEEVQTLYFLNAEGRVESRDRVVACETATPPQPLTGREWTRLIVTVALVGLVLFGLSFLVVDYGALWNRLTRRVVPVNVDELKVDTATMSDFLTVEKVSRGRANELVLKLKRTDAFPRTDLDVQEMLDAQAASWQRRLAVQSIAKGYLIVEIVDRSGKHSGSRILRIAELRTAETVEVSVAWSGIPPRQLKLSPM